MRRSMGVTFAMRDFDRLKCIQAVVDGELKPLRAAERLGLTTRQVRRLARRYAAAGPVALISKRFSRPSNNRLHDVMADRVIKLLRSTYADFGPTLATEKLRTKHGIDLAKETVRQLQIAVGLWIPRKLRPPKIQQPRMRRACIGELIQIDGCEHHWFEDRGPACTALVFIDDATSRLMQILFNGTESTFGYFEATRRYVRVSVKHYRQWGKRRGVALPIVWVAETHGGGGANHGQVHYHLVVFVPRGLTPPMPDKQGWWRKGMSNCKWARSPVGYLAKYTSKGTDGLSMPTGARLWGISGLSPSVRVRLAFALAPKWLQSFCEQVDVVRQIANGWWRNCTSGWEYRSPWEFEWGVHGPTVRWRGWTEFDVAYNPCPTV